MIDVLLPLGLGFVAAVVLTPLSMWIARRNGVVARPVKDRWSQREVPLLGGTAIFAAFVVAVLLSGPAHPALVAILAGGSLLFVLGLVDDVVHLRPSTKLVGQVVAACVLVALGVEARFVDNRLITIPLTIVWVVAVTNAFNLIDNMDGLCAGVGTIAAVALAAYALRYAGDPFPLVARVSLALAGAQAGFLVFNVNPARSFMGDAGALLIGFVLAAAAIMGTYEHAGNLFLILAVPVFVLGLPIFDTTFVTIVRKLNRRKISQGGKDHLSHRLVAIGIGERRAVFILWGICAALAGLAVAASYLDIFANLFLMGTALAAVVIFAVFLAEVAIYRPVEESAKRDVEQEVRKTFVNYVRGPSLVLLDLGLICLAWLAAHLVKFEGVVPAFEQERMLESLPVVIIAQSILFRVFHLYRGIWRYFGVRDLFSILKAVLGGTLLKVALIVVLFRFEGFSREVLVIDAMALFLLTAGSRFLFRALLEARRFPLDGRRVVVVGAGDAGELCLRALRTRKGMGFLPVAIVDPDRRLKGRDLLGVPVRGTLPDLERVARESRAEEVVLSGPMEEEEVGRIRETCDRLELPLYLAPVSHEFVRI
ncbi:MAG: hypothetical protein ABFS86_08570 [Planctomycetota bacterium]